MWGKRTGINNFYQMRRPFLLYEQDRKFNKLLLHIRTVVVMNSDVFILFTEIVVHVAVSQAASKIQ
jgi:hypothetical protein